MKPKNIEIIYEDSQLLVINKPAGLSATADRSGAPDLLGVLKKQMPNLDGLLVHRLDKETSGVMLIAKNTPSQRDFSGLFENRLVTKTYLAIVRSCLTEKQGTINIPLARHKTNSQLMQTSGPKGKPSVTNWYRLADFGSLALLAVQPLTGRTHQIRVHLAAMGMPLAIDALYGSQGPVMLSEIKAGYKPSRIKPESPLIDRLTLHAYQLDILPDGPVPPATYIARLDKKFAATIKMLNKHGPNGPKAFENPEFFEKILVGDPLNVPPFVTVQ